MKRANAAVATAARAVVVAATLLPVAWLVTAALTPPERFLRAPDLLPRGVSAANLVAVFAAGPFARNLLNSALAAAGTTIVVLVLASLASYALARLPVRGRAAWMVGFLALAIFPPVGLVGPIYLLLSHLGLVNSVGGLVLPYSLFALPLGVWILTHVFSTLPRSLEEAALLDGCSTLQALRRVVLPVSLPGLGTAALLVFIFAWNEFLFAFILTSVPETRTVPVAIALFAGQHELPWGTIAAAALVSLAPLLVLVALFEEKITEGLTAGAVRG